MTLSDSEKRRELRRRTLLGGRLSFNGQSSTINCRIRNLSESGAKLSVATVIGIPDEVTLRFDTRGTHEAKVIWRSADEVGVAFTSAA